MTSTNARTHSAKYSSHADAAYGVTKAVALAKARAGERLRHEATHDELTGLAGCPPDQLVASMRRAMLDFSAGNLHDDVTMLVVRAGRLRAK